MTSYDVVGQAVDPNCRVHFSENLSRNSSMQFPKRLFVFKISALSLRRKLEDGFTKTDFKMVFKLGKGIVHF